MSSDPVAKFISRWSNASAAERANYAMFLSELCDLLTVPRPDPATDDTAHNAYVFERAVTFQHRDGKTSTGRIDLYKRDSFVLEASGAAAKQSALELADTTDSKSVATKKQRFSKPPVAGSKHAKKLAWPKALAERAKAIESALAAAETPQTAAQLAKQFLRATPAHVEEILQTLVALSRAHESDTKGTYVR
jgi:hypothetical protein